MLSIPYGEPAYSGPGKASEIGIVGAELESASGPAVELVPESGGSLDDCARVSRAIAESARCESAGTGNSFCVAAGIGESGCTIANHRASLLVGERIEARRASSVLEARVTDEVQLLRDVSLEGSQPCKVLDQVKSAIAIDRHIGKACGSVAANAAAAESFQTESDAIGDIPASAGADAATILGRVVCAGRSWPRSNCRRQALVEVLPRRGRRDR